MKIFEKSCKRQRGGSADKFWIFLAPVTSHAELLLTVKDDPGVKSRRLGADPIILLRTCTFW